LTARLRFDGAARGAIETVEIDITTAIAGGQPIAPDRLTQAETAGNGTFLLAQPVLVGAADRLWLTIGAVSTEACLIGRQAWRFEEIEPHWDRLILRSFADGLVREARLAALGPARDLIVQATGNKRLAVGVALFCGAPSMASAHSACRKGVIELEDAVLGRTLSHTYS
jgi:Protein of unknown function (DUF2848)